MERIISSAPVVYYSPSWRVQSHSLQNRYTPAGADVDKFWPKPESLLVGACILMHLVEGLHQDT